MIDDDRRAELVDLVSTLVRLESENPPGNEAACAEYITDWFDERDIEATLLDAPDADRPQVGARVGTGSPTLVLNGHVDVVPAGDHDRWTHDPYGGDVVDGRLYGRGSADMKTGLAIGMLVLASLREEVESGVIPGSLVFHAAMGEETADPGTATLLESGFDGDYGVVLEPTDFRVATSAKGLVCYEISVSGEASHASRPDQGTNAISAALPVVAALDEYDGRLREREDDLVGRAYATITQFEAGTESNLAVLPERATFVLDRRVLPAEAVADVDEEVASVLAAVERDHGVAVEWERIQTYASASVSHDCRLAGLFREHTAAVTDAPGDPWGIEAATDVRNFVNDAGVEAITWGPANLAQAHTVDEHVDVDDAVAGLEILERATRDLLSGE